MAAATSTTNVTTLPTTKAPRRAAPPAQPGQRAQSRALRRRLRRQHVAALAIGTVATVLTMLSLSHLATGIAIVTGAGLAEAWAFAVGVDVAMISAELAMLFAATPGVRKQLGTYGKPFVVGTLAASAALNSFAFAHHCSGVMVAPAVLFGVAIPAMIYALTRMGAALYIAGDR